MTVNYRDISNLTIEDVNVHELLNELHDIKVLLSKIETIIAEYHTRSMR
jgi:hypothetical protein